MAIQTFGCPKLYIEAAADLEAKIVRIQAIIDALENAALLSADGQEVQMYSLDDGQTKITASARDAMSIARSIDAYERIKQRCLNQLNGRVFRNVDYESNNL